MQISQIICLVFQMSNFNLIVALALALNNSTTLTNTRYLPPFNKQNESKTLAIYMILDIEESNKSSD